MKPRYSAPAFYIILLVEHIIFVFIVICILAIKRILTKPLKYAIAGFNCSCLRVIRKHLKITLLTISSIYSQSDPRDSFAQIVTSSFPQLKEQEALVNELKTSSNYFDSFEYKKDFWGCWSCNNPEKIANLIKEDGQPAMEGQLKEKKSK